jgi:hypothetical protein
MNKILDFEKAKEAFGPDLMEVKRYEKMSYEDLMDIIFIYPDALQKEKQTVESLRKHMAFFHVVAKRAKHPYYTESANIAVNDLKQQIKILKKTYQY